MVVGSRRKVAYKYFLLTFRHLAFWISQLIPRLFHKLTPHKFYHTHMNFIVPMHIIPCSHDYWPVPALGNSQALTLFPNHNNNSLHILFFSNLIIATWVFFLVYIIMLQLQPCVSILCNLSLHHHPPSSILVCFVPSIKFCLHMCIWHVWISTSITTICVTSECTALLSQKLGFGGLWTVASAHVLHQPTIAGPSISVINVHKFRT